MVVRLLMVFLLVFQVQALTTNHRLYLNLTDTATKDKTARTGMATTATGMKSFVRRENASSTVIEDT